MNCVNNILETIESELEALAKEYRKRWEVELWESENIEEFGQNEYFGGKAEGFEEALEIIFKAKSDHETTLYVKPTTH